MTLLQWLVAAITSALVALVGILQWRTAQQKAVHELYNDRFRIYEVVKNCVDQVRINPENFDNERQKEFLKAKNEAYFFFGADVQDYLERLRKDLTTVYDTTRLQATTADRDQAISLISKFDEDGQPKFAKYMQFPQTVPIGIWQRFKRLGKLMWEKLRNS